MSKDAHKTFRSYSCWLDSQLDAIILMIFAFQVFFFSIVDESVAKDSPTAPPSTESHSSVSQKLKLKIKVRLSFD